MRWNPGTATRVGRTRSVIRSLYASLSTEDRVSSQPEQVDRQKQCLKYVPSQLEEVYCRFAPEKSLIPVMMPLFILPLSSSYLRRNFYQFPRSRAERPFTNRISGS